MTMSVRHLKDVARNGRQDAPAQYPGSHPPDPAPAACSPAPQSPEASPRGSEEVHARLNRALLAEGARRRKLLAKARGDGGLAEVVGLELVCLLVLGLALLVLFALGDVLWPGGGNSRVR